jgi:aspartate 1-decarboxylase
MKWFLSSQIHKATVTEADVEYIGSIEIDSSLLERVGLQPGEKVLVASVDSGARLETYVLEGEPDSGKIGINGAAAHLIQAGERVIIFGYTLSEKPIESKAVLVDEQNRFVKWL